MAAGFRGSAGGATPPRSRASAQPGTTKGSRPALDGGSLDGAPGPNPVRVLLAQARPNLPRLARLAKHLPASVWALLALTGVAIALAASCGIAAFGQATVNGLVSGSYLALGAIGLTLVYGVLRLVNFAHGDFLTFGAYAAYYLNVDQGVPFAAAAILAAGATALLGVALELALWRPMRRVGASLFQLLLMTIGVAFLVRNGIQFFSTSEMRSFAVDITSSVHFAGLHIGRMQLVVVLVGTALLALTAVMLKYTWLGKAMRALADNRELAEVAGIDTARVVQATWLLGAGFAGIAGVLSASSIGVMTPNLGFSQLLGLFAAAVLGGVGNAYGALLGGILLGLAQEWSTLFLGTQWKSGVGFAILVATLILLPQGLFGRRRTI